MSKAKLIAARELIQEHHYTDARALLQTMPNEATAQKWLVKLDQIAPIPRRQPQMIPAPPTTTHAAYTNEYAGNNGGSYNAYDLDRANARMKSYTGAVVLVLVLYFVLFIPGIIANVLYHEDGKRMEAIAGESLPGVRALGIMRKGMFLLLFLVAIPLAFVIAGRLM